MEKVALIKCDINFFAARQNAQGHSDKTHPCYSDGGAGHVPMSQSTEFSCQTFSHRADRIPVIGPPLPVLGGSEDETRERLGDCCLLERHFRSTRDFNFMP